jgi:hypothetical protein
VDQMSKLLKDPLVSSGITGNNILDQILNTGTVQLVIH